LPDPIEGNSKGYQFAEDEWHPIAMTWLGYPAGRVRLFIDGNLIGETNYDSRYDDGRSLPRSIAIGMRPPEWEGELILNEEGIVSDSRPAITMSVSEGSVEIKDLRLYQRALTGQEILALCEMGLPKGKNINS
jgi:hypothetical protein